MARDMTRNIDDQNKNEYCYKIAVSLCLFADIIFCPIYERTVVDLAVEREQRWLENTRVFCQREQLIYEFNIPVWLLHETSDPNWPLIFR